jgi:2-octaprenyl-6-methoxyphenol hydroxylase
MSLADTAKLLELAQERPDGLGDRTMLDAYHKARNNDIALRVYGIDLLNRASQVSLPALRDARALGLNALYSFAPVRRTLMQLGLGVK